MKYTYIIKNIVKKSMKHLALFVLIIAYLSPSVFAAVPTLNQSGFRWSSNSDRDDPRYKISNTSSSNDNVYSGELDAATSQFFAVGRSNARWQIQKRNVNDGSLVTAFGTDGIVTENVDSSDNEAVLAVAIDSGDNRIYLVGYDEVGTDRRWRIEKRDMTTGALDTSFDGDGIITTDPTANDDEATDIVLDTVNDYLYVSGYDGTSGNQWRLEKRRMSDGALCTAANCGTAFDTDGIYTVNPGGTDDRISALEIDPTNTYLYVAGYDGGGGNSSWRVDKMLASSALLCSAANCGTQFGTNGTYTSNPTSGADQVNTMKVDSAAGAIYVGGYQDGSGAVKHQWRIEKIDLSTAALITDFNSGGSITVNPSSNDDVVKDIQLDGAGGYIYIIGIDANGGTTNSQWRIEKRNRGDGSLVSAFGTSGVTTINPSSNNDPASSLIVDINRGILWAIGNDRTLGVGDVRWRFQQLVLATGTIWLADENTIANSSTNVTFRLRLLLHVSVNDWLKSELRYYKLQYSPKVGTCDTAFVGESYADVATSGSGEILYHDNPTLADGAVGVALNNDPGHSGHTVRVQNIEESNNFTNDVGRVDTGEDALFDFVLKDNSAFGAYCFRVQTSGGVAINTYTYVPEITFCKDDPKTQALLRHGSYFCEGIKKSYFWAL